MLQTLPIADIPDTSRMYPKYIPKIVLGYIPNTSGYIPDTSGYIPDTSRKHSRYIPDKFQIHPGYIPDTSQIHPGHRYIEDTSKIHRRYIEDRSNRRCIKYTSRIPNTPPIFAEHRPDPSDNISQHSIPGSFWSSTLKQF